MNTNQKDELWIGLVVSILVLLIGIIVGKVIDILEIKELIIGVGISITIILGIVAVTWKIGKSIHQKELIELINGLKEVTSSIKYDWLYTPNLAKPEPKRKTLDTELELTRN